jgi:hypothetical protein
MNRTAIAVVVGGMMLAGVAMAEDSTAKAAEPKVAKVQTTCPVMGGAIDKALYVDHDGKRIYVCCKGCIGAIQKDPAKFIKKLEAEGVTIEVAPADTNAVKAATAPAKPQ